MKFYAVRKGHTTGIFTTWNACKQQVHGFSGAEYKSFTAKAEAEAWLSGTVSKRTTTAEAVAYVDGSYLHTAKRFSYGVILFYQERKYTFSKAFDDPKLAEMRNVAGEIKGAECAVQFCIDHNIKSIDIYYDYEGIEKWANGTWKANKDGTKAYAEFIRQSHDLVDIRFIKVKGHSGDTYNDLVDTLAKKALGIS